VLEIVGRQNPSMTAV